MTHVLVWVPTSLLWLTAWLLASLAICILALSRAMARLATEVRTTTKLMSADIAAADVLQPALLILESLLPAHTPLLHKKRAFRTGLIVLVAVVGYLRVTAGFRAFTSISARW
jgi:hypothetical protein